MQKLGIDLESLREKWRELPAGSGERLFSNDLLNLGGAELVQLWQTHNTSLRTDERRRWYLRLYREFMRGKTILEIGSGFGFDGISFLQEGAGHWTFCDIAQSNLNVIRKVCQELQLSANYVFIDDNFQCFKGLGMYDVVWANGSLIHVPFDFARAESLKILPHLSPGGRWIELSYPRERWLREGSPPFSEWGKITDGKRTPWVEWYDLGKLKRRLFPAPLDVVLDFNFYNDCLHWSDLISTSDRPYRDPQSILQVSVFPGARAPDLHGDTLVEPTEDGGLDVVTPRAMWSYAVSLLLASSAAELLGPGQKDNGFTIELELRVCSGHVGILLVDEDTQLPICCERMVNTGVDSTIVIDVPPHRGPKRLIFRNTAGDTYTQFRIRRLNLRAVIDD